VDFLADRDSDLIPVVLSQVLDTCINGITLSDPHQDDCPLVYANEAFELITGYDRDEILGRNCRFLQGSDRDQAGIEKIREAMRTETQTTVTLRNYRKDGTLFHNQVTIRPIFDRNGSLLYFLGIQYDVTEQVKAQEELAELEKKLKRAGGRQ
jgi:PAS domain S-box-containing protein